MEQSVHFFVILFNAVFFTESFNDNDSNRLGLLLHIFIYLFLVIKETVSLMLYTILLKNNLWPLFVLPSLTR